jgi:PAS domain-containing protein
MGTSRAPTSGDATGDEEVQGNTFRFLSARKSKLTEDELRQENRELRRIIDAIPINLVVLDASGNVIDVNQLVLDHTGLTLEDARASISHSVSARSKTRAWWFAMCFPSDTAWWRARII